MTFFKAFALTFSLLLSACNSIAPTPILIGRANDLNVQVLEQYLACSEGANYVLEKEGCQPEILETKVTELLDLSETLISADFTQPHGYDIHLATAMMYFRIGQRNENDYTRAEQIARQFFETQKATSGRSIVTAQFYWAYFAAANASYQFFNDPFALDADRKAGLLLALANGSSIVSEVGGTRLIRLQQALTNLEFVINSIE